MNQTITPVLFILFNRPDKARRVFEAIRKARPKKLFIAADGPRHEKPGEKELCEKTRMIVNDIDWDCEVRTLFQDRNLGILHGPHSAIDWFFDNVEEGIILEDDCVPDQSFFRFCDVLLDKYRNDNRVMQISGNNFQSGIKRGNGSYYFSKFNHLWGWASWRRAWKLNDIKMTTFPEFKSSERIKDVWDNKKAQRHWLRTLERMYNHELHTWDYPWLYTFWSNSGLCILPNENLVTNIGFGDDATHTKSVNKTLANLKTNTIGEIKHPTFVLQDKEADECTYRSIFSTNLVEKIIIRIKSLL
jgi:hypothetical protein